MGRLFIISNCFALVQNLAAFTSMTNLWINFKYVYSVCQKKAPNGKEDHRAIIRYVSYDLKQRVFLDYNSLSESRFHDVWVLDGFCAMANGFPHINI